MGEVYLATDTLLDRKVALKLLPSEATSDQSRVRRFLQEAKAASSLNHPHIITIHEVGSTNSTYFIATEFIEGVSLREAINRGQLEIGRIIEIATQVALALTAAHEVNIIHRDIKPENIMMREDGFVKVLDFGLAKLLQQGLVEPEASTLVNTTDGIVLGTLSYMSPEQARGQEVDARTDVWSLGVVLYEMVSGRRPFEGTTKSDVLASVLDREPTPLTRYSPSVPADLERIIKKTLAKDPNERYQTARGLLVDLKTLNHDLQRQKLASEVVPPTAPSDQSPVARISRSHLFIGASVLLLLIGGLVLFLQQRLRSAPTAAGDTITLAILPFRPLNEGEDTAFLTTGLADAITTRLANVHQIRVRPTNAILKYEGQPVSAKTVGEELSCNYVVLGTLQKSGERLQVNVQLVRTSDEALIWGEQFDKVRTDILSLQDAVATQ
ncbi:MAG TPA: serine/threonine-protein kinase, partial [Pyrinomonadaceae bacterium]